MLRVAARTRIADQRDAEMIVVRSSAWIQVDGFPEQMDRGVIFLSFKSGASLLIVHFGHLGGREVRLVLARARRRVDGGRLGGRLQRITIAAATGGGLEVLVGSPRLEACAVFSRCVGGSRRGLERPAKCLRLAPSDSFVVSGAICRLAQRVVRLCDQCKEPFELGSQITVFALMMPIRVVLFCEVIVGGLDIRSAGLSS